MHGVAQGAKRIRHLCDSYRNKSARWTLPERRDAKLLEFIQFHAQRNINRIERLSRGRAAASGAFVAKIIALGNRATALCTNMEKNIDARRRLRNFRV